MVTPSPQQVTQVLDAAAAGDPAASEALLPLVYDELRRLARQRLSHEGAGLTLQPTALVHEAWLRLVGDTEIRWNSRGHFFAAAAQAMRRILIERARRVAAARHGGALRRIDLDAVDHSPELTIAVDDQHEQLAHLDEALAQLERRDPRKAQIVMLRFFAGLSIEQTALAMDLSPATIKSEWRFARAWLHSEMERHGPDD
jgi:RNA polymerase sigma factor (TIGR02999 family)